MGIECLKKKAPLVGIFVTLDELEAAGECL